MDSIKKRAGWIIGYIIKNKGLTNKKLGQQIGFAENTVASYRNGVADPKADFISRFCNEFNINPLWFLNGDGEPFPGAASVYPEVVNNTADKGFTVKEPDGLWDKTDKINTGDQKLNKTMFSDDILIDQHSQDDPFAQDVSYLKEIYDYNDSGIIGAIHQNLKTFIRTVRREKYIEIQNKKIKDLESECRSLNTRLEQLENKLSTFGRGKEDNKMAINGG